MNNSIFKTLLYFMLFAGLMISFPAKSIPVLELPPAFVGEFGKDYPVIDPVFDISDADAGTTDYFFEWVIATYDEFDNFVGGFASSDISFWPLNTHGPTWMSALFPKAGVYSLEVSMATFHQEGGSLGMETYIDGLDLALPFHERITSDSMTVFLVPETPVLWLLSIGLVGILLRSRYTGSS